MNSTNVEDKCTCLKSNSESETEASQTPATSTKKSSKISLTSLGLNLRRGRSLNLNATKRSRKCSLHSTSDGSGGGGGSGGSGSPSTSCASSGGGPGGGVGGATKKSPKWNVVMKFNCASKKEPKVPMESGSSERCCQCTCYRRTEEHHLGAGVVFETPEASASAATVEHHKGEISRREDCEDGEVVTVKLNETVVTSTLESASEVPSTSSASDDREENNAASSSSNNNNTLYGSARNGPHIIISSPFLNDWLRAVHEDCDEQARLQRAREIAEGVEPPPNFRPVRRLQLVCPDSSDALSAPRRLQLVCPPDLTVENIRALFQNHVTLRSCPLDVIAGCHTQVDFIHCLVPDLLNITNCSFYWGKMDRYEAERLLDGKPEGTFLLRDSAQEEFLFSVSFRKYGRSLHARIEQWNHKFSFDSHDPGVYTSSTVCGLIEHYKDPSSCMFFEPMLTWPLHRNFTFSLQHLCRSVIVSKLTYDNVSKLELPKTLKSYLKEYHYRQKVRVERFDDDIQWIDLRN